MKAEEAALLEEEQTGRCQAVPASSALDAQHTAEPLCRVREALVGVFSGQAQGNQSISLKKESCRCRQSCCQCMPAFRSFLPWGVSISGYAQGCPLWGHTTPALAECKTLKLWHWGKRQAACLHFDFNCLLGFSSVLAHCQGLSAGKWVPCVPYLA